MDQVYYKLPEAIEYLKAQGLSGITEEKLIQAGAIGEIPLLVGIPRNTNLFIRAGDHSLIGLPDELRDQLEVSLDNVRQRLLYPIEQILPVNIAELITQTSTRLYYIACRKGDYTGMIESIGATNEVVITRNDLLISHEVLSAVLEYNKKNDIKPKVAARVIESAQVDSTNNQKTRINPNDYLKALGAMAIIADQATNGTIFRHGGKLSANKYKTKIESLGLEGVSNINKDITTALEDPEIRALLIKLKNNS